MSILAITGGIGGAKLSLGLTQILSPDELLFLVNVGDDFEHYGLKISPDIDTLTYTLSGNVNEETGWGRDEESWHCLDTLQDLGGEDWFRLGDKDLALHLYRTERLKSGCTLTEVTQHICKSLGIDHRILPATDQPLCTIVESNKGTLTFQEYFVKERCQPIVSKLIYHGAESAQLNSELRPETISAVIVCPSNPFLSVDPILAVSGLSELLRNRNFPVIAISPIIASQAVKGPTAKIMKELNLPVTSLQVAEHYKDYIDGFVLDTADSNLASEVETLNIKAFVTHTWMKSLADKIQLAKDCQRFLGDLKN